MNAGLQGENVTLAPSSEELLLLHFCNVLGWMTELESADNSRYNTTGKTGEFTDVDQTTKLQ